MSCCILFNVGYVICIKLINIWLANCLTVISKTRQNEGI